MAYTTQAKVEAELGTSFTGTTSPTTAQLSVFITEAEGRINRRTGTTFGTAAFTDEILDLDENNTFSSSILTPINVGRGDSRFNATGSRDKFYLPYHPIISITSLYTNQAGETEADSWELRTEQSGSGGDFVVDKDEASIIFKQNFPRYGRRSIKVSGVYGHSSVPEVVSELATKLVAQRIVENKSKSSQFTSVDSISLEGISIRKNIGQTTLYLKQLKDEADDLWKEVGDMYTEAI